jgi:hypothetical protein
MPKPAAPTEWRLSSAERKPVRAPDVAPLVEAGRQFRPKAAFHRPGEPAPLPLFDYVPPNRGDEQALVDRVLDAVMRRMGA